MALLRKGIDSQCPHVRQSVWHGQPLQCVGALDMRVQQAVTTSNELPRHYALRLIQGNIAHQWATVWAKLPEAVPKVPLLIDVERRQKRFACSFHGGNKEMTALTCLGRPTWNAAHFFPPPGLLDIDWAKPETWKRQRVLSGKMEVLYHDPEQIVCIMKTGSLGQYRGEAVRYVSGAMTGILESPN